MSLPTVSSVTLPSTVSGVATSAPFRSLTYSRVRVGLGHFVALNSVYPKMRETAQKPGADVRVVFESSEMHKGAPSAVQFLTPEEINNDRLGPVERYGRSKLAMVLGAKYLAKNVSEKNGDGIYALSVHPGVVSTQMQDSWARSYPGLLGKVLRPLNLVAARTVAQGAYSGM